eukprot:TRINITY_DN4232_c0_g1_i2.p1 TRINITY_DN4232_c0_g1~~TRINITY_DN4232_c0_g1_i2.p1  ORF type:complete len:238 (-),score=39.45 TRINITY_DN4232_c0_g1_i2:124-837(-)
MEELSTLALNTDGTKQYSLTPHPNSLPQEFQEHQRKHMIELEEKIKPLRHPVIRTVSIEVQDGLGIISSFTQSKAVIGSPRVNQKTNPTTKLTWGINLSPDDEIRKNPFPNQGLFTLIICGVKYSCSYNEDDDLYEEESASSDTCFYLLPLLNSESNDTHVLFTHAQIFLNTSDLTKVVRVNVCHFPDNVTATATNKTEKEVLWELMDASRADNKRKFEPDETKKENEENKRRKTEK